MERKVYVSTLRNSQSKMHVKFNCCGFKDMDSKLYVTETVAREEYGAKEFCKKCTKPKSVHATRGQRKFIN